MGLMAQIDKLLENQKIRGQRCIFIIAISKEDELQKISALDGNRDALDITVFKLYD